MAPNYNAPDNVPELLENRTYRKLFFTYWVQALYGPWFGAKVLVMDERGDEWRELVVVGNDCHEDDNARTEVRTKEGDFLAALSALLKRHGVTLEKRVCDEDGERFENWSFEGEGIEIELEDAMDSIAAINGE